MSVEMMDVSVQGVPRETVEFLRPYARRQAHATSNAGVLRYAAVELERRLREGVAAVTEKRSTQAAKS